MKFAPFKPSKLPKHVGVEILHREFPVKNLYFPCKGLQCSKELELMRFVELLFSSVAFLLSLLLAVFHTSWSEQCLMIQIEFSF